MLCICYVFEGSHCSASKTVEWKIIRQQIKAAEDKVPKCTDEDWKDNQNVCKCYTDLITKDLKPFSSGITLQMIEDGRKR